MELLHDLKLVEVTYQDKKAVLVFLDEERFEIREVTFNKQVYDAEKGSFVDNSEKEQRVEEWCQEFFGLTFDTLTQAIGERKDVYAYDKFNSLYEVKMTKKFEMDDVGQIIQAEVTNVFDDGIGIVIEFEYEGDTYQTKSKYSDYLESEKKFFKNPQKFLKVYDKFREKFGVQELEELVGKTITCEIKLAFNKFVYVDVKPFPKKKK